MRLNEFTTVGGPKGPKDYGQPNSSRYIGGAKFVVGTTHNYILTATVEKWGLEWDEDDEIWFLDSSGSVSIADASEGEIELPDAMTQHLTPGNIHDLVSDYLNDHNSDDLQQVAAHFGHSNDGDMATEGFRVVNPQIPGTKERAFTGYYPTNVKPKVEKLKKPLTDKELSRFNSQGMKEDNFAGDTPINVGGTSMKNIQVGDTVQYLGQQAEVVDMSKDRKHSRITISRGMGGVTQDVLTSDLKQLGQSVSEGKPNLKCVCKTHGQDQCPVHASLDEGAEFGSYYVEELAQKVFDLNPNLSTEGRAEELLDVAWPIAVKDLGKQSAQYKFTFDEDFSSDFVSMYAQLQKQNQGVAEAGKKHDHRDPEHHKLDAPRPIIYGLKINGKIWKKDGNTVTFFTKERALTARTSMLNKKPELEITLIQRPRD
jgi:hypothetical protein